LRGPRHQFAVKKEPVGLEFVPESFSVEGLTEPVEHRDFEAVVSEEAATRPCVADTGFRGNDPKTLPGDLRIPTDNDDGTRAHVLLFADNVIHAILADVGN